MTIPARESDDPPIADAFDVFVGICDLMLRCVLAKQTENTTIV